MRGKWEVSNSKGRGLGIRKGRVEGEKSSRVVRMFAYSGRQYKKGNNGL